MIKMARSKGKSIDSERKLHPTLVRKIPLRFFAYLCLLTICQHIPNTSCQPFLNNLAVLLRSRPPWPTSFPASSQPNQVLMHPQNQQQHPQFIRQQGPPQHNMQHLQMQNVYPTSSEQFQNFLASNNLIMQQGPLSQGIPMVAMDPAQNSITIMTPTGPEQIVPPNPSGGGGGGIFVAQPIHSNDNIHNTHINNNNNNGNSSNHIPNPIIIEQNSLNGHNNNLASSQTIVQVLPNHMALDPGQNLLDGNMNMLTGVPTGSGNIAVGANFPNEQHHHHQSAGFQPSFHPQGGFHLMHSGNANNQQVVPPPPPPPIPKNLKGPAIIAVPKPLPSQNTMAAQSYFNSFDQSFQPFISNNPSASSGSQHQPMLFQSIHQLPNMSPAFTQMQQIQPQQQLISSPENAMNSVNNNITSSNSNGNWQSSSSASTENETSQFSFSGSPLAEKSPELVGNPRNQRKRHQKKQKQQQDQQPQQPTSSPSPRSKIIRKRPTTRPTQIPVPSATESYQNEIDSKPSNLVSDYSLSTIINMPSTTITGSFEYPDPPTPPNFESMNALKYPSPFEDSAEVVMKDVPGLSSSSQERLRLRDQKKLSSALNLHNGGSSNGKRKRVSTPATSIGTTAGAASSIYSSITSAASATSPIIRETTTGFIPSSLTTTKRDKSRRKGKSDNKGFRPSPQIHSFEEPVTGIKSYITILPPVTTLSGDENSNEMEGKGRGKKSLFSKFQAVESRHPPYEAGFKPVSQYTYAVGKGSMPAASTTTETLYFDLIREASSKAPGTAWSEPDLTAFSEDSKRQNRQFVTTSEGLTVTPVTNSGNSNYGYSTLSSTSSTDSFLKAGWKVKDHGLEGARDDGKRQLTTSASSERVEDWKYPEPTGGTQDSKIYFGNGKFGPPNCDKFHRFGFCPMNSGYPTDQVEKIASRCSALLSHLIAPLPKADVRYDVIVAKNGSMLKGRSAAPSGWSWKSFAGKPVCDTKEIKVVPGWAKNEQGEWLVILQTKAWKQEAQITLCTPQGTHYNCKGDKSSGDKKDCTPNRIKCVQRFTAQRLAVLDPENTDRCPVLRSVFLPSACVCLYDDTPSRPRSSSEELFRSSSSANIVSSKGSSSKGSSKKGSKGKKGNKKSTSKSKGTARTARSEGNSVGAKSSSEEQANKSDMLDTAADSSTSGAKAKPSAATKSVGGTFQEKKHAHHQEDDNVSSPEEEATVSASDDGGLEAKPLISTQPPTNAHTSPRSPNEGLDDDSGQSSQNEVEDENADSSNETGSNSTIAITTNATDTDDDENRVTTTVTSGDAAGDDESSGSEEKSDADMDDEKKNK